MRIDRVGRLLEEDAPLIQVSLEPSELITTDGPVAFKALEGTSLEYLANTTASVFREPTDQELYVLTTGRWFRAWTIDGPWEFITSDELPADIVRTATQRPTSRVLASIVGTPQAREAIVASQVPRLTTVSRQTTMLAPPLIDGAPRLEAIAGTSLKYVVNSPAPIVAVESPRGYYTVENGIWFTAASLDGPWLVAANVPADIYSIPPSTPVSYITYARIYDVADTYVTMGVTAGYFGALVSDTGTVVFGTGYAYQPWIGDYWFGRPMTYGLGAALAFSPSSGWAIDFGFGSNDRTGWQWDVRPWWGPVQPDRGGSRVP